MPRRPTKKNSVVVTEEQQADWDERLLCADELQKPEQVRVQVSGPGNAQQPQIKTFFVPLQLLTRRAPNSIINYIGYDQEAQISGLNMTNATTAAVEIFLCWVFTGYMPAAARYDKGSTSETPPQPSRMRPWLEAWVLGLDYNVPNFRVAVMSRISKTMLHRPVMPAWLPSLDDFNYVHARVPDPATPCL